MCCTKQRMRELFGFPDSLAHQAGDFRIRLPPVLSRFYVRGNPAHSEPLFKGGWGGFSRGEGNKTDFSNIL